MTISGNTPKMSLRVGLILVVEDDRQNKENRL